MEDPSLGPFDEKQVQTHDINPGDLNSPGKPNWFAAGGIFWTGAIKPAECSISPSSGDARLHLHDYGLEDYFTAPNAILRNPDGSAVVAPVPATAHVDVRWHGKGDHQTRDVAGTADSGPFSATYRAADVDVNWSVHTDTGFHLEADSTVDTDVNVTSAFTARVKNGAFL